MRTPFSSPFLPVFASAFIDKDSPEWIFGEVEGGATLAFAALGYDATTFEMTGLQTGTGALSTTAPTVNYAPDFEGVYRELGIGEPVISEGRVVVNHCRGSDDVTNTSVWTTLRAGITPGASDPDGGTTAFTITATDATANIRQTAYPITTGALLRGGIWIRRRTGTGIIRLTCGGYVDNQVTLTSGWQLFQSQVQTHGGTTGSTLSVSIADAGDEVDIWHPQINYVDGQANTNIAEYVENTTSSTTVFPQKVFATENGNIVVGDVVTEAVGDLLPELPWTQFYPSSTNHRINSNVVGTETNTLTVGTWAVKCFANGADTASCIVLAGTAVGTGFATVTQGDTIELDITTAGTVTIENAGTILNCNLTNSSAAIAKELGPIFTAGIAVSSSSVLGAFDSANHAETGAYYVEVDGIEGAQSILDGFLSVVGTNFQLDDGTTQTTLPYTSGTHKIGIAYAESLMALCVDGTWTADVIYDDTLLSGALDMFRTITYSGRARDLRRYDASLLQDAKDAIDEAMTVYLVDADGNNLTDEAGNLLIL